METWSSRKATRLHTTKHRKSRQAYYNNAIGIVYLKLGYFVLLVQRPMTMYSDEYPQERGVEGEPASRVIILPGDRQDIFTTSGLQKAAKVYESGEEQEGKLTTDRSRRLLESAGVCVCVCELSLIPYVCALKARSLEAKLDSLLFHMCVH